MVQLEVAVISEGRARLKSDHRQVGGFLLIFSAALTFGLVPIIVSFSHPKTIIDFGALISSICIIIVALMGMAAGFCALASDSGNSRVTAFVIGGLQISWVPLILSIVALSYGAASDPENNPYIPSVYNPTSQDIAVVGSLGIVSLVVYSFTTVGPVAFMAFALRALQSADLEKVSSPYYRKRALFYNAVVLIGGCSQVALGGYILAIFGGGALNDSEPITSGVYIVYFPEVSIFVGSVQAIFGFYGLIKTQRYQPRNRLDNKFQYMAALTWFCTICFQVIFQAGYDSTARFAAVAPSLACASIGFALMPAILELKIQSTPTEVQPEYYGDISGFKSVCESFSITGVNYSLSIDDSAPVPGDFMPQDESVGSDAKGYLTENPCN